MYGWVGGAVSFNVPRNIHGAFGLPTTTLVQILTSTRSAGLSTYYRWIFSSDYGGQVRPSSTLLGSEIQWNWGDGLTVGEHPTGTGGVHPNRATGVFGWPAGDEVTLPFYLEFFVANDDGVTIPINETATYELRYIPLPEPNASLTVPAGIGLLAGLAKLRGVPLVP